MSKTIQCIIVDDEPVACDILEEHISKLNNFQLIAKCKNAVEAFKVINEQIVDLIFLDINMPQISGLSFARSINKDIKIIFTTAYREYAADGFDLKAVDYLLKPISFDRFLQATEKYSVENRITLCASQESKPTEINDCFFVRADRKMVKISFSEILYIESLGDYIKIHEKHKTTVTRETISNIEAKLPKTHFIKTHRSYIIALDKINSFTNEFIELNDKVIPISRTYKKKVLERINTI
jgi:two-component system, LytTR family, response regulator